MTDASPVDRRTVIRGAGALCLGAAGACLLSACGSTSTSTGRDTASDGGVAAGSTTAGTTTDPTQGSTTTSTSTGSLSTSGRGTATTGTPTATTSPAKATTTAVPAGTAVKLAGIPVGGGVVLEAQKIVVTQPAAGTYKAFSAVCPHLGYLVGAVQGTINCLHHGSQFDIATGGKVAGPTPIGLEGRSAVVSGDSVYVS